MFFLMTPCIFAGNMELGRAQNEQILKVGRLIRPSVQPKISDYGYKVNPLIEKCLLYSAIQKSGRSHFGTQRYENFFEKLQNDDGI